MKRLLASLLILIAYPITAANISGTVKDLKSGTPLAAITVEAYTAAGTVGGRATTNASGSYALTLAAGSYRFLAYDVAGTWATSFHADAESFDVSMVVTVASSENRTIHFALQRGGFLTGTVRSASGDALPGMTVAVYNESGTTRGWTTTDATGAYRLVVPAGSYRAAAWDDARNYLPRFNEGELLFEAAPLLTVVTSEERRTDFVLPPASSISGAILDAVTLEPLAGMTAEAWDQFGRFAGRATTDATGSYRLVLENGIYQLVFYDPAAVYAPSHVDGATSLTASPLLSLSVGEARNGVTGLLERAATVSGRVYDASSGSPLEGIGVTAWNPDGTARTRVQTNQSGNYVLAVPAGTYVIGAQDDSLAYLPRFRFDAASFATAAPLTLFSGETVAVDLSLDDSARFAGTVRSASTGNPLSSIVVVAYDLEGALVASAISGPDGAYALAVAAGTYSIAAWHRSGAFIPVSRESVALTGEALTEDFFLQPASGRSRSARH